MKTKYGRLYSDVKASDFYDINDPRGMSTREYDDYMRAKNGIEFKSFNALDTKHDLSKGIFNAIIADANKQDQMYSYEDMKKCWNACLDFNRPAGFDNGIPFEEFIKNLKTSKI
jgi:hypothetical protein